VSNRFFVHNPIVGCNQSEKGSISSWFMREWHKLIRFAATQREAKPPEERFQTAKHLLVDLDRVGKFSGVSLYKPDQTRAAVASLKTARAMETKMIVLILLAANLPTYFVLGWAFFGSWPRFFDDLWSVMTKFLGNPIHGGEEWEEGWLAAMKLLLFVVSAAAVIGAEYWIVARLFLR
jgi:hypothetical protein